MTHPDTYAGEPSSSRCIALRAAALGHTQRLLLSDGSSSCLDVWTAPDADLDSRFTATCADTGETLRISGWLIADLEVIH